MATVQHYSFDVRIKVIAPNSMKKKILIANDNINNIVFGVWFY